MRYTAILLVLTACAAEPLPAPPAPPVVTETDGCPPAVAAVATPKPPITIEVLAAWGNRLRTALDTTEKARRECAQKLHRVFQQTEATAPS